MKAIDFKILSEKPAATVIAPSMIKRRVDAGHFRPIFLRNEQALVNGGFETAFLGDLYSKGNYGSLPDSVDYSETGIVLIRGTDLQSMSVTLAEAVRVPTAYYDKFKKARVRGGDILLLIKGASIDRPDSVAMFPQCNERAIANGSIFILRPEKSKTNPYYLLSFMTSAPFLLQKRRGSSNTGALYNDLDTIKSFVVPIPDHRIQDYIGVKVELAERCRVEARDKEQLALHIFEKYWEKSEVKLSGSFISMTSTSLLDHDRLDAEFYRPDLVGLQDRVKNSLSGFIEVGRYAEVFAGKTPDDKSNSHGMYEIVRVANLTSRGLNWSNRQFGNPSRNKRTILKDGDIIVCKDAHQKYYIGQQVDIYCRPKHKAIASSETLVIRFDKNRVNPFAVLLYLRSEAGYAAFQQQIRGTSAHLYPTDVKKIIVPKIPYSEAKEVERLIRKAELFRIKSYDFTEKAKSDVEALIEGTLDTNAILSGKLKPPTWEDVEKELKEM